VMNEIMKTEPLTASELAMCILVPGTVLLAVEAEKWLVRRGMLYQGRCAPAWRRSAAR
jgi:Ca2+-transporting ATPase